MRSFLICFLVLVFTSGSGLASPDEKGEAIRKFGLIGLAYHDAIKNEEQFVTSFSAEVSYGDMTGDGNEEAAVAYHYHLSEFSSTNFSGVLLYALRNGRPEVIANVIGGDLAYGGIKDVSIGTFDEKTGEDIDLDKLFVARYKPTKNGCHSCYGYVETTAYKLHGNDLTAVDVKTRATRKVPARHDG